MAFFDDFKDKAIDLAQTGVAKSKQLAEIAKLMLSNAGEEDSIKKAYLEMGKLYYAERGLAPDAAYAALCEKVTSAKKHIKDNKDQIEKLKSDGHLSDDDIVFDVTDIPTEPVVTVEPDESPFADEGDVPPEEPPLA